MTRRYYLTYRDEIRGPFFSFEEMMEWLRLLIRIDEQDGLPIDRYVRFSVEETPTATEEAK